MLSLSSGKASRDLYGFVVVVSVIEKLSYL